MEVLTGQRGRVEVWLSAGQQAEMYRHVEEYFGNEMDQALSRPKFNAC